MFHRQIPAYTAWAARSDVMLARVLMVLFGALVGGATAATPGGRAAAPVTFHREIVRLLQQHCQGCHRPGGSAPFVLVKILKGSG